MCSCTPYSEIGFTESLLSIRTRGLYRKLIRLFVVVLFGELWKMFDCCFFLSAEQMKNLSSKKYKTDHMKCFVSLVEIIEREMKLVQ